jgi:hypothetical protein
MGDALVFEVLDKVDRKKAFADTAFAVEDEIETFHVVCGLSIRTCAMRGPRERAGDISSVFELASGVGTGNTGSFGGTTRADSFFRETRLRDRMGWSSTSWQKTVTAVLLVVRLWRDSKSAMARYEAPFCRNSAMTFLAGSKS